MIKHLLSALALLLSTLLFAQNFETYPQHIAPNRMLLQFSQGVSTARQTQLINQSGLVTSYYQVPSPSLVVCTTPNALSAIKYFQTLPEVEAASFFITNGTHYAGVLNTFFVKLTHPNFEPLFNARLKQLGFNDPVADKYIPGL